MNECTIKMNTDVIKEQISFNDYGVTTNTKHVSHKLSPTVYVDGEPMPVKCSKKNNTECTFQTEKDTVEITLTKRYTMEGKNWFWMNVMFFFISLLGIFDVAEGRKFQTYTYTAILHLNGSHVIEVNINKFVNGQRALEVTGNCEIEEKENVFFVREDLKKRNKKLIWFKVCVWLALIAAIVIVILVNTL